MAKEVPMVPQHHCRYASSSDIFKGERWLLDAYTNSDPDHSFGDNNRSLVIAKIFKDEVEEVLQDYADSNPDEIKKLFGDKNPLDNSLTIRRLASLGDSDDVYVDLES